MIQDHMPDKVLDALNKVVNNPHSSECTLLTTVSEIVHNQDIVERL